MNRRTFLGGAGTALSSVLGGCLDDGSETGRNENDGSDENNSSENGSEENGSKESSDDDHIAQEGDTINGHIYNYQDEKRTFEVSLLSEDDTRTVNDEFAVEADSSKGIGTIGEVFVEYTVEVTVESLGLEKTAQFEPGGKGTLEIRLLEDDELEIYFLPID